MMEAVALMEMASGHFPSGRCREFVPETEFRDGGGAPGVFLEFRQLVSRYVGDVSLVLGNPEKGGRTRGYGPSVLWALGFLNDAETYRSRARAKQHELEVQNDRMAEFQRQLDQQKREIQQQQREINELKGHREPDNTAGISQRRDERGRLGGPAYTDDEMPVPLDGIKEQTPCDLHEVFRKVSLRWRSAMSYRIWT
ncbi:hypothetical protein QYE76_057332 [Lolium multiflorum]|uniref:Uncharacterized protein n=1 Tax=Lolium multiflorum TaxID=4521 RepID=A0AAD8WQM3_LOLMU|nr:hypothetical protein QYE76_057332 [Lolium multiflorum]